MKKFILIVLLLQIFVSLHAQVQINSLKDLLSYADSHSISIKTSLIQQNISKSEARASKSYLYPNVNASGGFNDNLTIQKTLVPEQLFDASAPADSYKAFQFGRQYNYLAGVQAQWNILDFQKMFASKTAHLQNKSDLAQTQVTRYNTYNQLASDYYSIVMSQYALDIYRKDLITTQTMLASSNLQFQKGIISESDNNEVAIQNLKNQKNVNAAEQNLAQAYSQLQIDLNTTEPVHVENKDVRQNNSSNILDTSLWITHPDITLQEAQVALAQSALKENKALLYPSLSINYQYNYNWVMSKPVDFSSANKLPQQFVGLKLNIPIFSGFSNKEKIKQSQMVLQQQQFKLQDTKISEAKQDEIMIIQYNQSKDELEKNKSILTLQERNDFHTANQYKAGLLSLYNRMDRYKDLLSAQNDFLQSLSDYTLAQYKIYIRNLNYK
ncbi:MAG: TolC family protein [Arachidicoccus sp.]|nr:TolC family protein [Arachidicoccus sp.]